MRKCKKGDVIRIKAGLAPALGKLRLVHNIIEDKIYGTILELFWRTAKGTNKVSFWACGGNPDNYEIVATPNPGSDAARLLCCTCPILDNAHGRGAGLPNHFWQSADCPLHLRKEVRSKRKESVV